MLKTRVIPCLLLRNGGLVKTTRFGPAKYVGDPINAVRIFNEKEVDELVFLDISATPAGRGPNFELLNNISSEAFMPFGYGGGVTTIEEIRRLFAMGVEKVILNTSAASNPELISEAASIAGSSSVVASVDVQRNWRGRRVIYTHGGKNRTKLDIIEYALDLESRGAGELLLNSIDRDGTMQGYDLELIESIASKLSIPVVSVGGAGELEHFRQAVDHGASAVAAGSMFVFHGRHRAVLITYPDYDDLEVLFK